MAKALVYLNQDAYEVLKLNAASGLRLELIKLVQESESPTQAGKEMEIKILEWGEMEHPPVGPRVAKVIVSGVISLAKMKRDWAEQFQLLIKDFV